jgi:hypothetical protein
MAREILHLDIGNTVTTARLLSRSSAGLKPISSAVVPTPGASSDVDLVAGAEAAYTRAKSERQLIHFPSPTTFSSP